MRKIPDTGDSGAAEGTITTKVTFKNGFVTQREVQSDTNTTAGTSTATTQYIYHTENERYANGAPKWGKLKEIIDPEFNWTYFKYDDKGWATRIIRPFKGSSDGTVETEANHDVTELDYETVGGGNAKDDNMLTERPRTRIRKVLGIEVEKTLLKYTDMSEGDSGVTTMQQVRVRGDGWDSSPNADADSNLQTEITRNTTGPANVVGPAMTTEYGASVIDGDTQLQLVATTKGPAGTTISVTAMLQNAFGITESSVTTESGVTTASAVSTLDTTFGFGRLKKTTYLADSLFDEITAQSIWGPLTVVGTDGSKTTYEYSALGWVRTSKRQPDQSDDTKYILTTSYHDALGSTIKSERLGVKSGFDNITVSTQAAYDILGRKVSDTNEMSKTTSYAHLPVLGTAPTGGLRSVETTQPDGLKSKVVFYLEGRQKEQVVDGTFKIGYPTQYDYGVDGDGMAGWGLWSKTSQKSGSDWTQSWVNPIGQSYRQKRSGASIMPLTEFDALGRQKKQTGFDGVIQVQEYDARNEVSLSFIDENDNGEADSTERRTAFTHTVESSPDRRERTTTVLGATDAEDQVSLSKTYFASHDSYSVVKNGMTTGMSPTAIFETTHVKTAYAGNGGWVVTTTNPDNSKHVGAYVKGEQTTSVEKDNTGATTVTVNYNADPLGRTKTMEDRRGTTTYTYNLAGQVDNTAIPGGRTVTVQTRDDMLRPTQTKRLDDKLVNMTYNPNGDVKETTGAGVYHTEQKDEVARPLPKQLTTKAGSAGEALTQQTYKATAPLPDVKTLATGTGDEVAVSSMAYSAATLRLSSDTRPGVVISPTFNSEGNLTAVDYVGSPANISYVAEYDDLRRLKKFGPGGSQVQRIYTAGDQVELETVPHITGFEVKSAYDDKNRRESLKLTDGGTPLLEYTYVYSAAGLLEGIKIGNSGGPQVFTQTYQSNSYLPKDVEFRADGTGDPDLTLERTYESDTNRQSRVKAFTSGGTLFQADYVYNNLDQRTSADLTIYRPAAGIQDTVKWHYASDGESAPTAGGTCNPTATPNWPPALATPNMPDKLVVIPVSPTRIDLAWTDMDDLEDGFKIERSDDGTTGWTQIDTVGEGISCYTDGGHDPETTKYYRVRAYKAGYGDSSYSPVKGATTPAAHVPLETPKDHLGVAVLRDGSNLRAGFYYGFTYDGIGNRLTQVHRSGQSDGVRHKVTHTPNVLNQVTDRTTPGIIHVSGFAPADHTVLVNGDPTVRDGEYFYGVVDVENGGGPVCAEVTVTVIEHAEEGDETSEYCCKYLVPKAVEDEEDRTYHGRGNLLTDSLYVYSWDVKDRLIGIQTSAAITDDDCKAKLAFEYDAFDRRTKKHVYYWDPEAGESGEWVLEKTIRFVYDGWLLMAEVDEEEGLIRSYIWGLDKSGSQEGAGGVGGLLAVKDHGADKLYWVTTDGNGNVVGLVDSSNGAAAASYEYSPYGELLHCQCSCEECDCSPLELTPLLFSTKYFDHEVGLYYYGYRYYDPRSGTWLNRDPIQEDGGLNLYAFCYNDPANGLDALGLADEGKLSVNLGPRGREDQIFLDPQVNAYAHVYGRGGKFIGSIFYDSNNASSIDLKDQAVKKLEAGVGIEKVRACVDIGVKVAETAIRVANPPLDAIASTAEFIEEPSVGNALGAIPVVGKLDSAADTGRALAKAGHAADAGNDARRLVGKASGARKVGSRVPGAAVRAGEATDDAAKLALKLTAEEQLAQALAGKGEAIIGAGTKTALRDAERLARQYGGNPADWAKMRSANSATHGVKTPGGTNFEIHWYENTITKQAVEFKTKLQ